MPDARPVLTIGHSPDPDDAFMWWPLGDATPKSGGGAEREPSIDTGRFRFRPIPADIEALNERAGADADLDITAMSAHAYPHAKRAYRITSCGASMGDGFGPKVVAREAHEIDWLRSPDRLIAVPGVRTTAYLALRLLAGPRFRHAVAPFDQIIDLVARGGSNAPDAGLIIHEGQLTYRREGLEQIVDLGAWWKERTGGALPLGLNAVRRDLDERFGAGASRELATTLRRSVEHAMQQRTTGLSVAMGFARGLTVEDADTFVGMYVNDLTIDMGRDGAAAIARLLRDGAAAKLCPDPGDIDVLPG